MLAPGNSWFSFFFVHYPITNRFLWFFSIPGAYICVFAGSSFAQKAAVLQKHGTEKRIYYTSGDEIRFVLKGEDHFRKDHVIAVADSGFQFHYHFIRFEEIESVDIRGKKWGSFNWNSAGLKVQIVGLGYIAIDTFNKTVVQGNAFEFDNTLWITGGSIFLAGTAMRFLQPRKIVLGGKFGFVYLNIPAD